MPTKVLMAESSDIYHDYRVQKEAASLAAAGYEVTVCGFRGTPRRPAGREFPFRVLTLPVVPRRYRLLRNLSIMAVVAAYNLFAICRGYDFYHAHNTMFLAGFHIAARLRGKRFIYDAHEVQWEHGKVQTLLEEKYIHRADGLINVSPGRIRVCSERFGIPPERFTLISNYPVVEAHGASDAAPAAPGPDVRMIFSGGFDLRSNRLDVLLRAMALVPGSTLDLMAFGYRDGEQAMRRLMDELDLGGRVRFIPLVAPDEVMKVVSGYDVAVNLLTNPQNHVSIRYCSTNKMYEYIAAGLPVLCSDLEAFVEEFVEPGAAFAVDADDVEAVAAGLRELNAARDRLPAMRETALSLSREKYNWSTQAERLVELYAGLG